MNYYIYKKFKVYFKNLTQFRHKFFISLLIFFINLRHILPFHIFAELNTQFFEKKRQNVCVELVEFMKN